MIRRDLGKKKKLLRFFMLNLLNPFYKSIYIYDIITFVL